MYLKTCHLLSFKQGNTMSTVHVEYHYCSICNNVFPDDVEVFECGTCHHALWSSQVIRAEALRRQRNASWPPCCISHWREAQTLIDRKG